MVDRKAKNDSADHFCFWFLADFTSMFLLCFHFLKSLGRDSESSPVMLASILRGKKI